MRYPVSVQYVTDRIDNIILDYDTYKSKIINLPGQKTTKYELGQIFDKLLDEKYKDYKVTIKKMKLIQMDYLTVKTCNLTQH